jgi:hypothetical protein
VGVPTNPVLRLALDVRDAQLPSGLACERDLLVHRRRRLRVVASEAHDVRVLHPMNGTTPPPSRLGDRVIQISQGSLEPKGSQPVLWSSPARFLEVGSNLRYSAEPMPVDVTSGGIVRWGLGARDVESG